MPMLIRETMAAVAFANKKRQKSAKKDSGPSWQEMELFSNVETDSISRRDSAADRSSSYRATLRGEQDGPFPIEVTPVAPQPFPSTFKGVLPSKGKVSEARKRRKKENRREKRREEARRRAVAFVPPPPQASEGRITGPVTRGGGGGGGGVFGPGQVHPMRGGSPGEPPGRGPDLLRTRTKQVKEESDQGRCSSFHLHPQGRRPRRRRNADGDGRGGATSPQEGREIRGRRSWPLRTKRRRGRR